MKGKELIVPQSEQYGLMKNDPKKLVFAELLQCLLRNIRNSAERNKQSHPLFFCKLFIFFVGRTEVTKNDNR